MSSDAFGRAPLWSTQSGAYSRAVETILHYECKEKPLAGGITQALRSAWVTVLATPTLVARAGAAEGWLLGHATRLERVLLVAAGVLLIYPRALFDAMGVALLGDVPIIAATRSGAFACTHASAERKTRTTVSTISGPATRSPRGEQRAAKEAGAGHRGGLCRVAEIEDGAGAEFIDEPRGKRLVAHDGVDGTGLERARLGLLVLPHGDEAHLIGHHAGTAQYEFGQNRRGGRCTDVLWP